MKPNQISLWNQFVDEAKELMGWLHLSLLWVMSCRSSSAAGLHFNQLCWFPLHHLCSISFLCPGEERPALLSLSCWIIEGKWSKEREANWGMKGCVWWGLLAESIITIHAVIKEIQEFLYEGGNSPSINTNFIQSIQKKSLIFFFIAFIPFVFD